MAASLSLFYFFPGVVLAGVDAEKYAVNGFFFFLGAFSFVDVGEFIFLEVGPNLR